MKLFASLLFFISLYTTLPAHSYGQRINLSFKNTPLLKVVTEIRHQTDYGFVLHNTALEQKRVDLTVRKATIRQVLDSLRLQGVFSDLVGKSIFLYEDSSNSDKSVPLWEVKGTITNEKGELMDRMTVADKSTGDATATNNQGEFRLRLVNKNVTLIITSATTEPAEIEVNGRSDLRVKVRTRVDSINEVIVSTGYQDINKARTSGSFVQLGNPIYERKVGSNVLDRIEGISPGVLMDRRGGNLNIQIRGLFTLTQSISQPLIVVDNFPYEGNIYNLNPNDVESVTILKDAAASSIWGARAGNGVIVVSMKKGAFNRPLRVSFNTNITFRKEQDLSKIPNLSPADYVEAERLLFEAGAYDADIAAGSIPLSPVVEILLKKRNLQITGTEAEAQLNQLKQQDIRNDFQRYLYRTGLNQQYAVNVNGGTEKVNYFFSAGYDRSRDNLVGNAGNRFTLRTDNIFKPFKNLQVRTALNYTQITNVINSPLQYTNIPGINSTRKLPLYSTFADAFGNPRSIMYDYPEAYTDALAGGKLLDWRFVPLKELAHNNNVLRTHTLTANLDLKYNFTRTLSGEVKYQYQLFRDKDRKRHDTATYFTRDLINRYTQVTGTGLEYPVPIGNITEYNNAYMDAHAFRSQLNFDKSWGILHRIIAFAGFELRQTNTHRNIYTIYAGKVNADSVYTLITGVTDDLLDDAFNTDKTDSRFVSLYSNASYTYKDRYVVTGSIRRDASNIFGVRTNQKWVPLWSAGLGWKISKESFFNVPPISHLNLRATYGYSGNVNNTLSALTTIERFPSDGTNVPHTTVRNYPNPQLRWEKVRTFNLGLDFATNGRRAEGSIEYFNKKATDVLATKELDPTVGIQDMSTNSANLTGSGIDFQINTLNINHKDFKWRSNFIYSHIRYKVSRYLPPDQASIINNGLEINPLAGYSPYLIVSTKWAGLDANGDPQGILNGQVSKNYTAILASDSILDYRVSGSALPVDFGSFINTFSWKRITVSANIMYKLNYYFRRPTIQYERLASQLSGHPDYLKRWQKPGDENNTNVPSLKYPFIPGRERFYANSEVTVEKGDHIRLDDIRLSYDFNKNNKIPFRQMQAYVYLSNLNIVLWKTNRAGIDPEFPNGIKPALSVAAGLKVDF